MKYRYIKRKDGRTQKAMVLASGRLKFVKNGGSKPRKATKKMATKKKHRKSTAMAHRRSSSPRRYHHGRRRRSRHGGGMGMSIAKIGGATLGLAYLLGDATPIPSATAMAMKIPGAKTFGAPAAVGVAALAVDRFIKPNRWLKLLGVAGVVLAAAKVGSQGSGFKWVGDADDITGDLDLGDDDDVGDEDED
jgi:hypothetical protein